VLGTAGMGQTLQVLGILPPALSIRMNKSGTIEPFPGVRITQVHADHSSEMVLKDPVTGKDSSYPGGEPVGHMIQLENGFKIWHMGDTDIFSDMALISEIHGVEACICPVGDRFTDGSYGVFYAGRTLATAIAETRHHRTQFLEATDEPAQELDMRVYAVDLGASLHDIRGQREALPALYHPSSYAVSQETAQTLRDAGSDGIVYESVRDPGGECAAVFRARLLSNCRQERHLCYVWDGREISIVYEKRTLEGSLQYTSRKSDGARG
jgi:hypothetical protein